MASRFSEPLLFSEASVRPGSELRNLLNSPVFFILLLPAIILSAAGCFPQKAALYKSGRAGSPFAGTDGFCHRR